MEIAIKLHSTSPVDTDRILISHNKATTYGCLMHGGFFVRIHATGELFQNSRVMTKTNHYILKNNILNLYKIFLFILIFLSTFSASLLYAEMLTIKGDSVNLRSGPGLNFSVLWEYGGGFPVEIVEKKKDWIKIQDFEKDTGWVHKSLLVDSPHMIVKANRNKDEIINIRQGPSAEDKIVGKAHYGVVFETVQQRSGWVEVKHESGLSGWISSVLLWGY